MDPLAPPTPTTNKPGTSPAKHVRELKVEDALHYLDQVKVEFGHEPRIYNDFLDIMKRFKTQAIDTPGVIEHVYRLFRGNRRLILGFNTFLPEGYKIDPRELEAAMSAAAQGGLRTAGISSLVAGVEAGGARGIGVPAIAKTEQTSAALPTNLGGGAAAEPTAAPAPPFIGGAGAARHEVDAVDADQGANPAPGGISDAPAQEEGQSGDVNAREFKRAITYVTKIKRRFNDSQDTYKRFLQVLHNYQKNQKSTSIDGVLEQVWELFADHRDLLMEFTYFLPDHVQATAKEQLRQMAARPRPGRGMRPSAGGPQDGQASRGSGAGAQTGSKRPRKRGSQAGSSSGTSQSTEAKRRAALASSAMIGGSCFFEERIFFERARDTLSTGSRNDGWNELIRVMDLFGKGSIDRQQLNRDAADCFGRHTDLFKEFRELMHNHTTANGVHLEMHNFSLPLSEIDFSQCDKCTPSYRRLPGEYPPPSCSSRSALDQSVLNDEWMSVPMGSEDNSSFKHMRKNEYEERLFKVEDERFEIDMIIDSNRCTIVALEKLAKEIESLKMTASGGPSGTGARDIDAGSAKVKTEHFAYQLAEDALSIVHYNAIVRLYGDAAGEIVEHLHRSPAGTIPIVLRRLKQKAEEWTLARTELNKKWKDECEKNYFRSKDHRSFQFQRSEKRRLLSCKSLVNEIKDALPEEGASSGPSGGSQAPEGKQSKVLQVAPTTFLGTDIVPSPLPDDLGFVGTPQILLHYQDVSLLRDVYRVMAHAIELSSSPAAEKVKVASLWRTVIGPMLGMPQDWFYGGTAGTPFPTAAPQLTRVLCGPQQLYCFLRLHHAILNRLRMARELCQERDMNHESMFGHALSVIEDPLADEAEELPEGDQEKGADDVPPSSAETLRAYGKHSYHAFLNLLNAVVDGSIDSNKYEDSCRVIVGNRGYVCYTLERVIAQATRQLGVLANNVLFRECLEARSMGTNAAVVPNGTGVDADVLPDASPAKPVPDEATTPTESFRDFAIAVRRRELPEDTEIIMVQCCTGGANGDLWIAAEIFPALKAKEETDKQEQEDPQHAGADKMAEEDTVQEDGAEEKKQEASGAPLEAQEANGDSPPDPAVRVSPDEPVEVVAVKDEPTLGPGPASLGATDPGGADIDGGEPPAKKLRKEE